MAKLIVKCPYIKASGKGGAGGYLSYIATRENVQKLADDRPATPKQQRLITRLTVDFPQTKELFEYEDYRKQPTKAKELLIK